MSGGTSGVALRLTADGDLMEILVDEVGLVTTEAGPAFSWLLDEGSREKGENFLAELARNGSAYDWELTVQSGDGLQLLSFSGSRVDDGVVVLGARSREAASRLYEEMIRINNEQVNIIRDTLKQLSKRTGAVGARDSTVYDGMTELNNELASLQREMARKNALLESLNEQKNRLLGTVAHDLRNPLGVISAYARAMSGGLAGPLNEQQSEFVRTIESSSEFMLKLCEDLLDLQAIESGRVELELEPFDLRALAEEDVRMNRVLSARKEIDIDLSVPEGPLEIVADKGKIRQVLGNLLSNAVKFSQPATTIQVRIEPAGESVTVAVQDQGPGIPAEELAGLFEPFGRTSVQSTAGEKSTGLGLSIVRRIIEAHGGSLTVHSTVGEGSTFEFELPKEAVPA